MQELNGRLQYEGNAWKLATYIGEIDLSPIINEFAMSLNDKRVKEKMWPDCYTLEADEDSSFQIKHLPGKYVLLRRDSSAKIQDRLDKALLSLSGRMVKIELENGKKIRLVADKAEKVFGVYFVSGNSCEVLNGNEQTICNIGQSTRCIFLRTSACRRSYCEKFNWPIASVLLSMLANDEIRKNSRIGNCELLGRKDGKVAS